ncbi:MAG: aminotransferase class I/II-fold pyridoxal phosphate-dependent enzyme [Magnetospirillum sp.]|nr:aminotransferase class I/II-fold pyridoxal phosphate-dependent enzyme [Magnetospirillum sp.]
MPFKVAPRGDVAPFMVMDVLAAARRRERAGGGVIHLEIGQPSDGAPARVRAAAAQALDGDLGYTLALGAEPLRARIADHYRHAYGVGIDPGRVVVTTGSSAGFVLAFLAAFSAGDRVAVALPGYPAYRNILKALDIDCVPVPVGAPSRYQMDVRALESVAGRLDGVVLASPSNPAGSMLTEREVAELAAWCERAGVRLIADEIYHGIAYGAAATTVAGCGHAVVVNSFSKYYGMTGWRLGWMVVPPDLAEAVERLQQNLFIAPPTLAQMAAVAAFDCPDELDGRVRRYRANRDVLLNELPSAGFRVLAPPEGAFFLYADIGDGPEDSPALCRRMLDEIGVAVTPGLDFDPARGHRTVRFSYAGPADDIVEAARRIRAWRK